MREAESSFVSYMSAQKEFGIAGQMMVVDTKNGIYNFAKIVVDKKNAIQYYFVDTIDDLLSCLNA